MKLYLKILILFVFVFCKLNLFSQSPRFETYKILKNKKNVEINTIFQDNIGYIWLGTNYGLVKYDGSEFVLFTKKDSLADNYITSINQDYKNNLWIGHKSGKISIYNRKHFAEFNPEEGVGTQEISSFFINNKNTVFFSTYGEGVYYYAGEKRKRLYNIDVDNGLIDSYVYDIVQDFNSNMYFATDKGISIYNIERKEFIDEITMSDGLPDNIVKHMIIDKNILWIAMEDAGVCKYNITNKQFSNINNWKFGSINSFIKLNDRELWLSTVRNGIVQINYDDNGNSYYTVYNENNKLANNRTKSIFKDRENNVWIGTRNGLSIRRNNNFEFLDKSSGLNIDHIFSLVIDDAGNYWIASNQGLFVLSKNNLGEIKQKHLHNLKSHSFIALYKDSKGFIWAGTYGTGVFKINPITYEYLNFNSRNGLSNDNIIHISENKDNIWLSTLGGGVIKYNEDSFPKFTIYTSEDGLTSDYIYSTFTDSKDRIWVTTDGGGVVYFYNDSIYHFQTNLDSVFKTVYSVIEDNKGNLWFNSPNNGLFWYNGNNFFNYNAENALRTNSVLSISTDQSMNPVIVSNEGVEIFDTHDSILKYYGESVGVAYKEPNLNSIFKDKESNIWIGTNNGILKLNSNTENEEKNNILPNIFITEKQVFNQPIPENQISFKYNKNHLSFYYTGLWFSSSEKLLYRYKLHGYDLDWNAATNLRMVTYSSLPPGKYKFLVQVSYSEGKWIGSPNSEYSFKIRKPFWKTIWFLSLVITLVLFLIFIVVKARIRKLQRDKEILEEEVQKRTAEIEAQKDEIEKQRNHVIKQRDKIEFQNNEITSSIEYASRIQQAALPPDENFNKLLKEHFIFFKPRDIVSGDFYFLNKSDEEIIIAAADCTGHGVPGALMSILGISLLNKIIIELPKPFDAADILNALRNEIKMALRQTGKDDETRDGMDISLCIFNKKKNKINFAGAYNSLIIIRDKEIIKYKADRMPIGIYYEEKPFTNQEIKLKKNDLLYMYSDGFPDQFGGDLKKKFLTKNLNNLLLDISGKTLSRQKEILNVKFKAWKGELPQVDDIIILGFRI